MAGDFTIIRYGRLVDVRRRETVPADILIEDRVDLPATFAPTNRSMKSSHVHVVV